MTAATALRPKQVEETEGPANEAEEILQFLSFGIKKWQQKGLNRSDLMHECGTWGGWVMYNV